MMGDSLKKSILDPYDEARRQAMLNSDTVVLEKLLADDLIWIHASSQADDKKSLLQKFRTKSLQCLRLDHFDVSTRSYGTVTLHTGLIAMDVRANGATVQAVNRYAAIWVDGQEGIRLSYWQSTNCHIKEP
jgi:Domain of unknown function (DUF4440)